MISNDLKERYMQILAQCKVRRAESYTQKEIAELIEVSLRKYVDFENKKIIDFGLLCNLAGLTGYKLEIYVSNS